MANGEVLGASFEIDISNLKAGLSQANRLIKESNSEFKAAAAGMDDWTKSEEGLMAKKKQLNRTLEVQNKVLDAYQQQLEEAGYAEDDMSKEAVDLRTKINNQKAAVESTKKELSKMDAALEEVRNSSDEAGDSVDELADEFDNAESSAKRLDGGFTVMKGTLANLVADGIRKCVDAVKGLVDEAISASDSLYKFEQTMGFAGYDGKTIDKAQKRMKDYADKTVYDLDTISNTTAQLAANGIKDFSGLTEAAGNLNAVAGGNADTFQSVAMVLTQTAGAGKLTTENWNQLANAIPGASGQLQEALKKAGAYTGDFREAMADGEITADEFNAAIMELGNDPVAVEAAKSVETFEGAVGNMQATVVNGLMEIIDTIGMENITGFINKATEGISWFIDTAIPFVVDNLPMIATLIGGVTTAITAQNIATKIKTASDIAAAEGLTLVQFAQQGLNAAMKANPIGLIITLITALVAAFMYLWNNVDGFKQFFIDAWENIKNAVSGAWEFMTGVFSQVGSWFSEKFNAAYTAIKNVFTNLPSFFSGLWTKIKNTFVGLGEKIGGAIGGAVKSAINGIITLIENRINDAVRIINGAIGLINKIPGVSIGNVKEVSFPRLARGGIVDKATHAVVGEDGKEAIVPLERNTEWIDRVAEAVVKATGGGAGVIVNQTNNYSQAHSRYEIYKSKQETAAAVRLAMRGV